MAVFHNRAIVRLRKILESTKAKVGSLLLVGSGLMSLLDWIGRIQTMADILPRLRWFLLNETVRAYLPWLKFGILFVGAALVVWAVLRPEKNASEREAKNATADEWKDLADRFKTLGAHVRADWEQWNSSTGLWRIAGGKETAKCESLCRLAGAMLMRSPNTLAIFPVKESEPELGCRWLYFLKDRYGLTPGVSTLGWGPDESGKKQSFIGGCIQNLGNVSEAACLDCAAESEK